MSSQQEQQIVPPGSDGDFSLQNEPRLDENILNAQIAEHSSKNEYNSLALAFVAVLVLIVPTTWVCGANWGYWGGFGEVQKQADLSLETIPRSFGTWKASGEDEEISQDAVEQLELSRYVIRRFVNTENERQRVSLIMMVGPTGRLAAHTPKVCFGGQNFTLVDRGTPIAFPYVSEDGEERKDVLTKLVFRNNSIEGGAKIFYYGANTDREWIEINDEARYSITRKNRFMYKLQVEAFVAEEDVGDNDVVARFLKDFLPEIRGTLVKTR